LNYRRNIRTSSGSSNTAWAARTCSGNTWRRRHRRHQTT
jgi:hypothetical protein